jgi:predicted ATPase/class 3 adenylate cyclase
MATKTALLLTDLVDSTRLTEELGDAAMSALWREHDRVSRDLLGQWRGLEINRSDGFLLRFESAADAAGYAIAYQHALGSLTQPLRARVGLHVGPILERVNLPTDVTLGAKPSELAGLAIPTVGRVMALAGPGQTLLTAAAREALGTTPLRIESHGHWRFKGVEVPIELFEIGDDAAAFSLPRDVPKCYRVVRHGAHWLPARDVAHSLPAERNTFVGRQHELRELDRRLQAGSRLVSIVGTGGTGKTRLVQHFGWQTLGDFDGGIWYCDLSQATTFDGVCGAVAQGLNVRLGQADPVEQVAHAIASRGECVVVLDNFEQVSSFARDTLGKWLDRAMHARFVVTSRTVLGVDGEEVFALATLSSTEGADLFKQRAIAARSDFRLASKDHPKLDRLVALLDGLPLAIELAAARVRVMSIDTLVDRMRERFRLLASHEGRPSRHSTLEAAFDWSWDLLSATDRAVAAQLSVFEGGFDVPAVEAIVRSEHGSSMDVIDQLQSLVEKSWVQFIDTNRFGLLKSVQDYLRVHLDALGKNVGGQVDSVILQTTEQRHWEYFAALDKASALQTQREIDNLVVAVRRATSASQPTAAANALFNTWKALKLVGPYRTAIELADGMLRLPAEPLDVAKAQFIRGGALQLCGHDDLAREAYLTGLALAKLAGDRSLEARLLCALAEHHSIHLSFNEAGVLLEKSKSMAEDLGDADLLCHVLNAIGTREHRSGLHADAVTTLNRALKYAETMDDARWVGGILGNLGAAFYSSGQLEMAELHYRRALEFAVSTGDQRWEGNIRCNLGLLLGESGKLDEGVRELELAEGSADRLGHVRLAMTSAWNLGIVCEASGRIEAAQKHYFRAAAIASGLHDDEAYRQLMDASQRLDVRASA